MTIRFVAEAVTASEDPDLACRTAGIAENRDGSGFFLLFQSGLTEPDEQDIALGMDSHCLITPDGGTAYACVTELALADSFLRVVVAEEAREPLGLDDTEIEARLAVSESDVAALREGLRPIMDFGRPSARPTLLQL
ncbi:Imm10 family immunity protein [Amycolatopsis sp. CA-230715]|uniref:Imm10 family immunity protein n=1 Tax=Amycolatopsis sp. CA-230715 TaxID=2745196 RepID=UPI001C02FE73|nr:Imm10 family immunity protein [Amycolatopsis sp. CA-230715]QWF85302.1 hypothetical protein HUW46_08756 [Amycolatopsis sp. CA-230715]